MIDQLFGSKTRVKLLRLFYSNPNRSFYVREITRKIDEQINSVRRELSNLLSAGIISSDTTNNRLYYEINQKYEYYDPLSTIFSQGETAPVKQSTAKTNAKKTPLQELGNVELAITTGQFTKDESTGVDFLLVGDVNPNKLDKYVSEWETKEGKEIRYVIMTPTEFAYRDQVKDRFLSILRTAKKQIIIDENNVFGN